MFDKISSFVATLDATPAAGAPLPNINNILGVMLICGIIAAYLFGMSSSQAYIYYDRFPKDPWSYKLLVATIWALDTLHTILLSHTIYHYTVTHFGDYSVLAGVRTVFSFNLEVVVVPLMATIVQCFFAYRAYMNDRGNWLLAGSITILALAQLGFGFGCSILAFTKMKGFDDLPTYNYILVAWLASGAVGDILVTVSLIWTFWRNKTTFTEEDGPMTMVLMYGVHTGLFTTIVTFLDLAFVIAMPNTTVFTGLNYILGKLYVNTLLYALNRRPALDSNYTTKSASTGSRSGGKPHNASTVMPTFAVNNAHSLSAPRVAVRDPYAADAEADYDMDGKPHSLTGEDDLVRGPGGGHVVFKPDQASEVSYITMDKGRNDITRNNSDY